MPVCVAKHSSEHCGAAAKLGEGCRLKGELHVNKVSGGSGLSLGSVLTRANAISNLGVWQFPFRAWKGCVNYFNSVTHRLLSVRGGLG